MVCDAFVCKIKTTCLYASDCSGACRWVVEQCRACALERGCKGKIRVRYYKEGKTYYKEV